MSKNRQKLKISIWLLIDCLGSQANIVAFDVGLDVSLERRPVVFSGYQLASFLFAKVAYKMVIVVPAYQL